MEKLKEILLNNNSPRQIVFKNTFWLYLSEAISRGIKLLTFIFIVRNLGPEQYGTFEYLFSLVGTFFIFSDFGVSSIFVRDYQQKDEKERHINIFFTLKLILSLIFGILAIFGFFLVKEGVVSLWTYLIFVIFYFLANFDNFFETYFIAIQKAEKKFIFNFVSNLVLITSIILGLSIYKNIFIIILAYLISAFVGFLTAYFLLSKEFKIKLFWDKNLIKYYLYNGLPLALFGLLAYIFFTTDKIILTHLRSFQEVGYYSLASRIISILFIVPSLFNAALYPYLANKAAKEENKKDLFKLFKIVVVSSILIAIFIAILVFLSANFLIPIFFGDKYLPSIQILNKFIWIIIFIYPTVFLDHLLISYHKQWLDFWITLIPAILNIILNFILIPTYGVFGAVYASIFAQFLNFALTFVFSVAILSKKSMI